MPLKSTQLTSSAPAVVLPSAAPPPLPPPPGLVLDKDIIDILEQEVPQQYRTLYEFTPVQSDDLFLCQNEIVYVVQARDDGWCQGMNVHGATRGTAHAFNCHPFIVIHLFTTFYLQQGWVCFGCLAHTSQFVFAHLFFPAT